VRIQLDYDAARRKPHQFTLVGVRVAAVPQETMDLEQIWIERCVRDTREIVAAGGLGMMMYALECGDICEHGGLHSFYERSLTRSLLSSMLDVWNQCRRSA
jgi:hypothetical protein